MDLPHLLIVDDDSLIRDSLQFILARDFRVNAFGTRQAAVDWLRASAAHPDIALIDLGLPPSTSTPNEGFRLINDLLAHSPNIRILVLSGQNEESNARRARALGAIDLVPKPSAPEKILAQLKRALQLQDAPSDDRLLLGSSPGMMKLRSQIDLYAASTFPALIEGESGSGKERVASALHQLSPRAQLPFLALNCAAISASLVEPTLFGHAKGAFTGAASAKSGYFEEAGEGTLFLDEVGELPLDLQPKLLRVLENGEYQRVGETATRRSRARIVAATNRDLKAEVKAGRFRADLYHRLSVFTIAVPPLRDLGRDKLELLEHFRNQLVAQHACAPFRLSAAAENAWLSYPFPGNVRELKNIVIRLIAKHAGYEVSESDLIAEFASPASEAQPGLSTDPLTAARTRLQAEPDFSLDRVLQEVELTYFDAALSLSGGNISRAARMLGMSRSTLYSRLEVAGRLPEKAGDKLVD